MTMAYGVDESILTLEAGASGCAALAKMHSEIRAIVVVTEFAAAIEVFILGKVLPGAD